MILLLKPTFSLEKQQAHLVERSSPTPLELEVDLLSGGQSVQGVSQHIYIYIHHLMGSHSHQLN